MKRIIIVLAILTLLVGCAAKSPDTTDKQDKRPKDSEIVKDIGSRGK